MENVTRKNQLYFDFGRDYDASLENFFFSSKILLLPLRTIPFKPADLH